MILIEIVNIQNKKKNLQLMSILIIVLQLFDHCEILVFMFLKANPKIFKTFYIKHLGTLSVRIKIDLV